MAEGDIRLSVSICHASWSADRRAMVTGMVRAMGGNRQIAADAEYFEVTDDKGSGGWHGVWPNHRRAWQAYVRAPGATHHLVLEDDLLLCRDFLPGVKAAIASVRSGPISLYSVRKIVDHCRSEGLHWAEIVDGSWGQALVLPVEDVREFLAWDKRYLRQDYSDYDGRLLMWSLYTKRSWWCTQPSLVEHLGAASSTIGFSNKNRTARWFIGANASALDIDWSLGAEHPPKDQDKRLSWKGWAWRWSVKPDGVR